jgi:hypothetical protein
MSDIENGKINRRVCAVSPINKTPKTDDLPPEGSPNFRYKRPPGLIYFIRAGETVKIGYTMNVAKRMAGLQSCNPETLELLAAFHGGQADERSVHRIFASLHLRGEWFRYDKAVIEYIDWRMGRKRMRGRLPTSRPSTTLAEPL